MKLPSPPPMYDDKNCSMQVHVVEHWTSLLIVFYFETYTGCAQFSCQMMKT